VKKTILLGVNNRSWPRVLAASLFGLFLATLWVPAGALGMTYGQVKYSDASMGSDGTIYGWGVTDANSGGCYCHSAKVTTTLRSPNGRTQTFTRSTTIGQEYARADVYLLFDQNDVGNYTISSRHWAYCRYCSCNYINNALTSILLGVGFSFVCYYDPVMVLGVCIYNLYVTPTNNCAVVACNKPTAGMPASLFSGSCPPYVRAPVPWYWDRYTGSHYCLPITLGLESNPQCFCEQYGPY
jgi:hypothetical protein